MLRIFCATVFILTWVLICEMGFSSYRALHMCVRQNGDHHITYMELLRWWKTKNKEAGGGKITGEQLHEASGKFHECVSLDD